MIARSSQPTPGRSAPRGSMRRVAAVLVLAATVLLSAPSCMTVCKAVGLCSRNKLTLGPAPTQDFTFILKIESQLDPPADTLLTIRRDGASDYRIVRRAPTRVESQGKFTVKEDQIIKLYELVQGAGFERLDARFPSSGDGSKKAAGITSYSVRNDDFQKEVQTVFDAGQAPLEAIKRYALSLLPDRLGADSAPRPEAGDATNTTVVGDTQTRRFYAPSSPLLSGVPAERRRTFANHFIALDLGFEPSSDWVAPSGNR